MATIFKNPHLQDYFLEAPEVTAGSPSRSYVPEYEAGKVIVFPNFKLDIDFQFWASLPTDQYRSLKKLACEIDDDQDRQVKRIRGLLEKAQVPTELCEPLWRNMSALFKQVMPVYYDVFRDYVFSRKRVVFRLNKTLNENLHCDAYRQEFPEHFARMFVNLDTQPRIWHTSYTAYEICERFGRDVGQAVEGTTSNRFWWELSKAAFQSDVEAPRPRHVLFFDPGDVWVVDSRQVSHQILYGRRAASFDFFVPVKSMLDENKHYLTLSEKFRAELLAERQS